MEVQPGRFSLRLALVVLMATCVVSCAEKKDKEGGDGQFAPTVEKIVHRTGLYSFDGTNTDASKNSVIYQMHNRAKVRVKYYFAGPDLYGSKVRSIIESGKAQICNDWRSGRVDSVALTGYSRGAIIAMAVAHELLLDPMSGRPQGCEGVTAQAVGGALISGVVSRSLFAIVGLLGRGDSPVISHLALLDAVNTLNYDIQGNIPAQVRRLSPSTTCFHFTKAETNEHVLTTLRLEDCTVVAGPSGVKHQGLAQLADARQALEQSLTIGDLSFVDAPELSDLPFDDYRPLCPRVKESVAEQRTLTHAA